MKIFQKSTMPILLIFVCIFFILLTCEKEQNPVIIHLPPVAPTLNDPGNIDTDGSYTVSWSEVEEANNYILQEDDNSSFSSPDTVYNESSTSILFQNKSNGTYYYRINCSNSHGSSEWSDPPVDLTVQLPQPMISAFPDTLDFGTNETTKSFNVTNGGTGTLRWHAMDNRTWINNPTPDSGNTTSETDNVNVTISRNNIFYGIYDGQVNISSNGGNKAITVLMTIPADPKLMLSPHTLDFDSTKTSLFINLLNGGDSVLSWSGTASESWISIYPDSGKITTDTEVITARINKNNLDCGNYTGKILFFSNAGTDSIEVIMKVSEEPEFLTNVTSLDFDPGDTNLCFTLTLANCNCGDLSWIAGENCTWLTVEPWSGTLECQPQDICVSVDRNGLPCGSYTYPITISSQTGQSIEFPVTWDVIGDPELSVSTSRLHFWEGETTLTFDIENTRALCDTLEWNISNNQNWLSISPSDGETTSETDQISVSIDRQGLDVGVHSDTISINSNGGNDFIAVTMDVACNFEITRPNSEDSWSKEQVFIVQWESNSFGAYVKIELYKNTEFQCTLWDTTPNDGKEYGSLGNCDICTDSDYRLKIIDLSDPACNDFSDDFSITSSCLIQVTNPISGESLSVGESKEITWDKECSGPNVRIVLYKGNFNLCSISEATPNDGLFTWIVDDCNQGSGSDYWIKIYDTSDLMCDDNSDHFTITGPGLKVTEPYTGINWCENSNVSIEWDPADISGNVTIDLYAGSNYLCPIISSTSNDGAYSWTVDDCGHGTMDDYRIKVTSLSDASYYDFSDNFQITARNIGVLSPSSGDNLCEPNFKEIQWVSDCVPNETNVKIEAYKGSSRYTTITQSTANDGSFNWRVDASAEGYGTDYRIKVTSLADPTAYGYSDYFSIEPCITITEPDPGEIWNIGDRNHITWQKGCAASGESAKIRLYKGDDLQCIIISDVANDGDWVWTVTDCGGGASSQYWIAILSLDNSYCYGISEYFTIQ